MQWPRCRQSTRPPEKEAADEQAMLDLFLHSDNIIAQMMAQLERELDLGAANNNPSPQAFRPAQPAADPLTAAFDSVEAMLESISQLLQPLPCQPATATPAEDSSSWGSLPAGSRDEEEETASSLRPSMGETSETTPTELGEEASSRAGPTCCPPRPAAVPQLRLSPLVAQQRADGFEPAHPDRIINDTAAEKDVAPETTAKKRAGRSVKSRVARGLRKVQALFTPRVRREEAGGKQDGAAGPAAATKPQGMTPMGKLAASLPGWLTQRRRGSEDGA